MEKPNQMIIDQFASNLKLARRAAGYASAAACARALGIPEKRYMHYEAGRWTPQFAGLIHICQGLSVTPDELLPGVVRDIVKKRRKGS